MQVGGASQACTEHQHGLLERGLCLLLPTCGQNTRFTVSTALLPETRMTSTAPDLLPPARTCLQHGRGRQGCTRAGCWRHLCLHAAEHTAALLVAGLTMHARRGGQSGAGALQLVCRLMDSQSHRRSCCCCSPVTSEAMVSSPSVASKMLWPLLSASRSLPLVEGW